MAIENKPIKIMLFFTRGNFLSQVYLQIRCRNNTQQHSAFIVLMMSFNHQKQIFKRRN